ncbi:MAG: hypothetical protein JWR13_1337 [Mycobacterium sp.]|jgi:uncharacterized protein (DUF2252 family)|nr:hypothetical protein [Mycobacterium sp.]MDT5313055.1 hypothetical protein [Mycobacterium sp.]
MADFVVAQDRPDPVDLLESQARLRISDLVPVRYGRMLQSRYAFFRGAALLMAYDLASAPHTGLDAQLCGDAHMSNFGLYASPERSLVFDINDFDETLPGPWEWDVKRLVTSVAIVAQENGFGREEYEDVVRTCARAYRDRMRTLATMRELDVWYARTVVGDEVEAGVDRSFARAIRQTATKAHTRDSLQALSKLTRVVDGRRRLVSDPPLLIPIDELVGDAQARQYEQQMSALIDEYRQSLDPSRRGLIGRFRYVGSARKVVGVGSVGTRAWVVLLLGRDDSDPLLMQVKEAEPSVMEHYLGASGYANAAERVVQGERLMQASSDILLGWLRCAGPDGHEGDYYVRQLRDWKTSVTTESMTLQLLADYGQSCAHVLARAHARTGDRVAIAGYLGNGDVADIAFARFAEAYARQNERDFAALREAVASSRVTAATDS